MTPKPVVLKGYAIYNPVTGLFSRGGCVPKWSKNPKIWSNIGHIKNHLNMLLVWIDYRNKEIVVSNKYRGCVLLDVTTMQPVEGTDIYSYAMEVVNREKETDYRKNYNVRIL